MSADGEADCFSCRQEAAGGAAPLTERIVRTDHWRLVHAFDSSLLGWLILVSRRHVLAFDELSAAACAELGRLVHTASGALRELVGCTKTYLMQFSEAEGYAHLHVHLVPRMPDQPVEVRGPKIFYYLGVPEADRVPAADVHRLCTELATRLS